MEAYWPFLASMETNQKLQPFGSTGVSSPKFRSEMWGWILTAQQAFIDKKQSKQARDIEASLLRTERKIAVEKKFNKAGKIAFATEQAVMARKRRLHVFKRVR